MLTCIFLAGSLFFQDGRELMNFHHATKLTLSRSGSYLSADFGSFSRDYEVPQNWKGLSVDELVQRCAMEASALGDLASQSASRHENPIELEPIESDGASSRRTR